jgi:polyhydroxybutyrate depolymerase
MRLRRMLVICPALAGAAALLVHRVRANSDQANVNDTKFISQLIDKLAAEYSIDAGRVYVAGMSNGGFMSGRLACELSEKIPAMAIVGCQFPPPLLAKLHGASPP